MYSKIIKPQIISFNRTNSKMIWKSPIMIVIEAFRISEIYRPLCQKMHFYEVSLRNIFHRVLQM